MTNTENLPSGKTEAAAPCLINGVPLISAALAPTLKQLPTIEEVAAKAKAEGKILFLDEMMNFAWPR